jgi:hypothetical protein
VIAVAVLAVIGWVAAVRPEAVRAVVALTLLFLGGAVTSLLL